MSTMSPEGRVKTDNAGKLAAFLGTNPDAFDESAESLASRFQLPEEFVQSVLSSLNRPQRQQPLRNSFSGIKALVNQLRAAFRKVTAEPMKFIAVSSLLAIAIFLLLDYFWGSRSAWFTVTQVGGEGNVDFRAGQSLPLLFGVAGVAVLLHQACYFRYGQVRLALLGGVTVWVITATTIMVVTWVRTRVLIDANIVGTLLLLSYVMFMLSAVYSVLSTVTSVLGATYWVQKSEAARGRTARQDLIRHLFDLRDRLANPRQLEVAEEEDFWHHWTHRLRPWFVPVAVCGGFLYSVIEVSLVLAMRTAPFPEPVLHQLVMFLLVMLVVVRTAMMSFAAFIGGRLDRAIVAALLFLYSCLPLQLIPFEPFGMHRLRESFEPGFLAFELATSFVVATIAALGARVEKRNRYQRQLKADDRAAILAEIVRTEWQLARQTVDVCVLVVDVVQSSRMKLRADSLEVEFSFREYQQYVAAICGNYGGVVHSTAGDGAVVAFYSASDAYEAAKRIHDGLREFNSAHNRLKSPFKLRIGLHMGQVAGDIGDIQFSEVIDIAAHFEAAAPHGGIAMSQTVADHLPHVRLQPLDETVSGHRGYSWLECEEANASRQD